MVSESTASNTELSEFCSPSPSSGERAQWLPLRLLRAKVDSQSFSQKLRTHRVCPKTQWVLSAETVLLKQYHHFQNYCTHEITIFKLCRRLQLKLSGVFQGNMHYSHSFPVLLAECSYGKDFPSGMFKKFLQSYLHELTVFETQMELFLE